MAGGAQARRACRCLHMCGGKSGGQQAEKKRLRLLTGNICGAAGKPAEAELADKNPSTKDGTLGGGFDGDDDDEKEFSNLDL